MKRYDEAVWIPSKNHSGGLSVEAVVVHYTAGGSIEGAVDTFLTGDVSAHFVVGRDGRVVQMVDLDRRAWHAGVSRWAGRKDLNTWSIGIELVNWGWLRKGKDGEFRNWTGGIVKSAVVYEGFHKNGAGNGSTFRGEKYWQAYTCAQYASLSRLLKFIKGEFGVLRENVVGHDDVAPYRKVDPGPAFQWKFVLDSAYGSVST